MKNHGWPPKAAWKAGELWEEKSLFFLVLRKALQQNKGEVVIHVMQVDIANAILIA